MAGFADVDVSQPFEPIESPEQSDRPAAEFAIAVVEYRGSCLIRLSHKEQTASSRDAQLGSSLWRSKDEIAHPPKSSHKATREVHDIACGGEAGVGKAGADGALAVDLAEDQSLPVIQADGRIGRPCDGGRLAAQRIGSCPLG